MVSRSKKKIRYAVVGLGHIAQVAVLPAFKNCKHSELAALVSSDETKLRELGAEFGVEARYTYDEYDQCLQSGDVDAVFIALPNHLHCEYTVRAAERGVHVLCEKPMAVTEEECRQMIDACRERDVKLMIAYRLHFEEANMKAVEIAQTGELGRLRLFQSLFSMPVAEDNIRIEGEKGGGTLYDIGIYCINAARYLFRDEPIEVTAISVADKNDERFQEVDEATSAVLRFPGERIATFTSSFGAADAGTYQVCGTEGDLRLDPAFTYHGELTHFLTKDGKTAKKKFRKRDQFAVEIDTFSECVLNDTEPEASGTEGLADVRIIEAIYESAMTGRTVELEHFHKRKRPSMAQEDRRPPVKQREPVNAESPRDE
jgi:predicted dehydrogenase